MSFKVIERMQCACKNIWLGFRHKDIKKVNEWLKELEEENNRELKIAKEFKINFLLTLHGAISEDINNIKENYKNPKECIKYIKKILHLLRKVVDQRPIREQLIKKVIHPILKEWGYKKKASSFTKKEGEYTKKLNIYTSKNCDYYDVLFIFEVSIEGPKTNIINKRVTNNWFKLTQDVCLDEITIEIKNDLIETKSFLDNFK